MGSLSHERRYDPLYNPSFSQIFGQWRHWRIMFNLVPLLTLGLMGPAILPVPFAFSSTGIVCSTVSMVVIALCMIYTCDLLLWQSLTLGMRDYETLSHAVGGKWYRIFTEVWLVILMVGTLISTIVQVGEVCASGILFINEDAPKALVNGSGRILMVIAVLAMAGFVFAKSYRSLELVGDCGFVVVVVMVIVVMVHAIQKGLPAISDGGLRKIGWQDVDSYGNALSTFGFIFYLHPVMMPVLDEMPPGVYGVRLLQWGTRLAIGGTGFILYYLVGFFGAAAFGQDTEGNILENNLGGNGKAQGALNIFFAVYAAFGLIPFEYACRHALDSLVVQMLPKTNQERYALGRTAGEGFLIYAVSLGVALAVPGQSVKIIAATGATGVLFVCYYVPTINHYLIWIGRAKAQTNPEILDSIIRPQKPDDDSSVDSSTALQANTSLKDSAIPTPEWNQAGVLQAEIQQQYVYTTYNVFWRAFHLILPIVVCAIGTVASVLTLKGIGGY